MSDAQLQTQESSSEETCAQVDFLSHTCVVCGKEFNKRQNNQVTCGALGCRFGRQRKAIRKVEHEAFVQRQWARRRAKSRIDLLAETRGTENRDAKASKIAKTFKKDHVKEFVGSDQHVKPACFPTKNYTPLDDHEHTKRTKRLRDGKLPRKLTNYCPLCKEYVTQDHEHI